MSRDGRELGAASLPHRAWRELYRTPVWVTVAGAVAALTLLLPLGLVCLAGAAYGVIALASGEPYGYAISVAIGLLLGGVLTYYAANMVIDAVRAPRTHEGVVTAMPIKTGGKSRYHGLVLGDETFELRGRARGAVRVGQYVRVAYNARERTVRRLEVPPQGGPPPDVSPEGRASSGPDVDP